MLLTLFGGSGKAQHLASGAACRILLHYIAAKGNKAIMQREIVWISQDQRNRPALIRMLNAHRACAQVTERILDVVKNFDKVEPSKVRRQPSHFIHRNAPYLSQLGALLGGQDINPAIPAAAVQRN